jgi:hypothetical protein
MSLICMYAISGNRCRNFLYELLTAFRKAGRNLRISGKWKSILEINGNFWKVQINSGNQQKYNICLRKSMMLLGKRFRYLENGS